MHLAPSQFSDMPLKDVCTQMFPQTDFFKKRIGLHAVNILHVHYHL